MTFNPSNPGPASPADVATYFANYITTVRATSQLNADVLTKTRSEIITALNLASAATGADAASIAHEWLLGLSSISQLNADALTDARLVVQILQQVGVGTSYSIRAVSLQDQSAVAGGAVGAPPSVIAEDVNGQPVAGQTVTFAVTGGGGSRTPGTVVTGVDGIATLTSWTTGASVGVNTLTATLGSSVVTFTANGTAALPTQIAIQSGGAQTGKTVNVAATTTVARVKDVSNAAVQGVTVRATIQSGRGSLNQASAVTDASGDASFIYTPFTTVETATLAFTFTNAAGVDVTVTTTIASTAAAASKLVITTQPQPSGAASNVAFTQQPVLAVTDQYNNVRTDDNATVVTASLASGTGTIGGTVAKTAVAGIVTYTNLKITGSATYTILFDDGGALTDVTSGSIVLVPPAPVALSVAAAIPGNAAGAAWPSVAVRVVDNTGATVAGSTATVTAAISVGGTLGGTAARNAASGVATFDDLTGTPDGTYTVTFSSPGLTDATTTVVVATSTSDFWWVPAGATLETDHPFINGKTGDGWTNDASYNQQAGILRATSAVASVPPEGEVTIQAARYPASGVVPSSYGGGAPLYQSYVPSAGKTRKCYVFGVCIPAGWLGDPTASVNKLFFLEVKGSGGTNNFPIYLNIKCNGSGGAGFQFKTQGCPPNLGGNSSTGDGQFPPGAGTVPVTRDNWILIGLDVELNTFGLADGVLKIYSGTTPANMTLKYTKTDLCIRGSTATAGYATTAAHKLRGLILNPTRGGGAATMTQVQYIEFSRPRMWWVTA